MNSGPKNFLMARWRDIAARLAAPATDRRRSGVQEIQEHRR